MVAIKVENISKKYHIGKSASGSLLEVGTGFHLELTGRAGKFLM